MKTRQPVIDALNSESWHYLLTQAPELLTAIEDEIASGQEPEAIYRKVVAHLGPDRQALAVRIRQAALYAASMQRAG